MYVYKITNKLNGLIYIGCTSKTLKYRFAMHIKEAKREAQGKRPLIDFHKAMLEYGFDNFYIEPIEQIDTETEMFKREAYWIEQFDSINPEIGYNRMTGGKSGKKNAITKAKISEKKKLNWQDESLAEKMRNGLAFGTEVWKKKCKDMLEEWVCPICGRKFQLQKHIARDKKFCSLKCAAQNSSHIGLEIATKVNIENSIIRRSEFKERAIEWAGQNVELILKCPYNKISTTLSSLIPIAVEYLHASDWRVVCFALCESYSKKQALDYLKDICENICRSGLN